MYRVGIAEITGETHMNIFSPEFLVALKPFGVVGLIILAIVAVVSLVGNVTKAKTPIAIIIALVILADCLN
jgi:hypothetical protein